MGSLRDSIGSEIEQDRKAAEVEAKEQKLESLAGIFHTVDVDSEEGRKWLWAIENMDKCYRNRNLIELLG
jgi:hypothetical protein